MKKVIITILLLHTLHANAQSPTVYLPKPDPTTKLLTSAYPPSTTIPQWYKNLEKYWYYRYRLVNDFMLIGPEEGMSIPAQKRNLQDRHYYKPTPFWPDAMAINEMEWQDATIDLGHYIATLATEYKMLNDNHWDVTRTLTELQYAQAALYRLSNNAAYYENVIPTAGHGYPGLTAYGGFHTTTANYSTLNSGFFLRDDVPFATFVEKGYSDNNSLINWKHFNRLGINPTQTTNSLRAVNAAFGAFSGHYNGTDPNPSYSSTLPYLYVTSTGLNTPNCESQDQLGEVFTGEALVKKYLAGDPLGLQTSAVQAINQFLHYPSTYKGAPVTGAYYTSLPVLPPMQPYWSIPDPIDNTYCAKHDCSSTGLLYPFAAGMTDAEYDIGGATSDAKNDKAFMQRSVAYLQFFSYPFLFEATQHYTAPICGDNGNTWPMYVDPYVAFDGDYAFTIPLLAILPLVGTPYFWGAYFSLLGYDDLMFVTKGGGPYSPLNTSFKSLVYHADGSNLGTPQYPLIWELNNYNEPIWDPVSGLGHNYISNLLDQAPPCGPYNYEMASVYNQYTYNGNTGDYDNVSGHAYYNGEWSCADRLSEPYKRRGTHFPHCTHDGGDDAEYNGLDYMMLFNLYALERGGNSGYLGGIMNPYYCTNYEVNYPDVNNYGSTTYKLQLNWLEYLSLNNHIVAPSGWVAFRSAKVIDLLPADPATGKPGFLADYGSFFQAAIKDYSCAGDTLGDGVYNFATLNPTPPYYIRNLPTGHSDTIKVIPNKEIPIVYLPKGTGFVADNIPDDPNPEQNRLVDSILSKENRAKILELYKYLIYNNKTKDPETMAAIQKLFGWENDTIAKYVIPGIYDSASVTIYPNPTHGESYLVYQISNLKEVRVILTNTLGQDFSNLIQPYEHTADAGEHKITIKSNQLIPGIYYCSIYLGGQIITKKLVVEQ